MLNLAPTLAACALCVLAPHAPPVAAHTLTAGDPGAAKAQGAKQVPLAASVEAEQKGCAGCKPRQGAGDAKPWWSDLYTRVFGGEEDAVSSNDEQGASPASFVQVRMANSAQQQKGFLAWVTGAFCNLFKAGPPAPGDLLIEELEMKPTNTAAALKKKLGIHGSRGGRGLHQLGAGFHLAPESCERPSVNLPAKGSLLRQEK